jgi:hypothetical protein
MTMSQVFNVYCDESCHMENDHQKAMVLGAIWCPLERSREIAVRIREFKARHDLPSDFEIKWTKVSPAKVRFYLDIVDYFFDDDDLHFRALIVPDKPKLRHQDFDQTHDDWYYKMYFDMLKIILRPDARYRIYIDIKDTRGGQKVAKLHEILCSSIFDFSRDIIQRLQLVRSNEVEIVQMTDLLTGAIAYVNRGLASSRAKLAVVERMRQRSGYQLTRTTLFREDKVNLFVWRAAEKSA